MGGHTGGRAPPFLAGAAQPASATTGRLAVTLRRGRSHGGAWARRGSGASLLQASRVAPGAQESTALPPRAPWTRAWGFPRPESRLPGKIPAPFPAPRPCPAERGEGIPGICPETALASRSRTGPYMGSASVTSAGKAPARSAGRGPACTFRVLCWAARSPPLLACAASGARAQGMGGLGVCTGPYDT